MSVAHNFLLRLVCFIAFVALTTTTNAQLHAISDEQINALELKNFIFTDHDNFFAPLRDSILRSIVPGVDLDLVKDRMSCYEASMPLTINSTVLGFIKFFTIRKRNYTQTMLERQGYYFPIFEKYLAQYGLPDDLKYLSIVESGLKFNAKSRSGAVGLWQFMPSTGKDYRLEQSLLMDERQHPELATEAACRYLKTLYNMFNDWELALAAYNCGPGTILRAIKKSGKRNFWDLYPYLPLETRSYVPQFVAVVYSMNYAAEHNIFPDADSVLRKVQTDTIKLPKNVCLYKLEKALGCDSMQLRLLNPVARTTFFPSDFKYPLYLPAEKKEILVNKLDSILAMVETNEIPKTHQLVTAKRNTTRHTNGHTQKTLPGDDVASSPQYYKVQKGEGLLAIARKHKTTLQDLMSWNNLDNTQIHEGQELIVRPGSRKILPTPAANNETQTELAYNNQKVMPDSLNQTTAEAKESALMAENCETEQAELAASSSKFSEKTSTRNHLKDRHTANASTKNDRQFTKVYQVQQGDTLYSITKKFEGLTIEQIKKINRLKSEKLKVGQTLILG